LASILVIEDFLYSSGGRCDAFVFAERPGRSGPGAKNWNLLCQGVFDVAGRALDFALGFFSLAFDDHLGVADDLACGFLDSALGLFGRADDTISVHVFSPFGAR
jgi:hypothetical protein